VLLLVIAAGCSYRPDPLSAGDHVGTDAAIGGDAAGTGDATLPIAAPFALTGQDWLLPCIVNATPNSHACTCSPTALSVTRLLGGTAGERWHVTVRVRGVMERMGYSNGSGSAGWYVGGNPDDGANNYYKLTIDNPASHYFLNAGNSSQSNSWEFDYEATFDLDAGATLTFESSGQDSIQWEGVDPNDQPISVAGITDPPQPYNGQFARIDVLAAEPF